MAMNVLQNPSPQILSGTVVIAAGQTQTVNLEAMASRSHRWLRLEELAISLYSEEGESFVNDYDTISPMGAIIKVRARAYRQDLMRDYVPVWLLGPRIHQAGEIATTASNNILNYGQFECYRWKFPKPFYLPPGAAFVLQLQNGENAGDGTPDITAQVVIRATQLSEAEAKEAMRKSRDADFGNPIPYISVFSLATPDDIYTPASEFLKSSNLELANPFLVPFHLQRITGRILELDNGMDYLDDSSLKYTLKLTDTRTIICDLSDLISVFPRTSLGWTHTRILQPAEYLTAEFKLQPDAIGVPQIAMIGYRNEVMP